jgi:hypothetical protein
MAVLRRKTIEQQKKANAFSLKPPLRRTQLPIFGKTSDLQLINHILEDIHRLSICIYKKAEYFQCKY